MTVQNIWPLAFLVLVPFIILLYILKQRAVEVPFSSNMLWREIYKNLEARTPFEKWKNNILMYLQILILLLLLVALMAPTLKNGGKAKENVVLVVDTSASMEYRYEDEKTRLQYSVDEAKHLVDGLSESAVVTLVTCDEKASVVYQGSDKTTLKNRLKSLETHPVAGNLSLATPLVNSLITDLHNVQVVCYTDTGFESREMIKNNEDAALCVYSAFSKGENCSMDYVNYSVSSNEDGTSRMEVLCKITNDGEQDVHQDVSLYQDGTIVDVKEVTIKASDSETVYFDPIQIGAEETPVLKAELSEEDALPTDNAQSIRVDETGEKKVLLLSKGNVFLEKALSLDENVQVYKSEDVNVLDQSEEDFRMCVLDGVELPDDLKLTDLYEKGIRTVWFVNYGSNLQEISDGFAGEVVQKENAMLSFVESPVTDYVNGYEFGVTKTYTYTLPSQAVSVIQTSDGEVAGYYGQVDAMDYAVLGFDLHNTDLALQTEFPIFISQLADTMLHESGSAEEISNFPVQEESNVTPVESVEKQGTTNGLRTGGRALRNIFLVLVLVLLVLEWIVYIRQVHTSKKRQFFIIRTLLMFLIVLAMAGLSIPAKQKKCETVFLVDVSDSMVGNLDEMETYLKKTIQKMPDKNLCSVVAFGKDTVVDQFLSDKKIFSEFTVQPVTTATNIEKAVVSASQMFDEDVAKRIVLLTDGNENEGNMNVAAAALKGSGVELLTIPMEDSVGGNKEVYIAGLDVPAVVHIGDHYNVTVSVESNVETAAVLSLYAGRTLKGQQEVRLNKGTNQFVFEDEGMEETMAQYRAVIEPDEDTIAINNSYVAFSQVEVRPRILLVEGTDGEAEEFEKILDAANILYDKITPQGVPTAVSELNQYKAVITLDVYYDDLRDGFAKALKSYVRDFAGGYICIGGENSFALGNYRGTELEEILPVYMDLQGEKEIPKMAMAMVVDQSGSMSFPTEENSSVTGLTLAKQAARAGVQQLRNTDEIGVMAFDDTYQWIVPIQTADDLSSIEDRILSIGDGGGTSIYPAVKEAYNQIKKSDAKLKHILLLTDGQDEFRDYDDLIENINDDGITLSTVAVGTDADQDLLRELAERCGGRYYYTDMNNSIPRIFAQEVYLSTNTYLVNDTFYPTIADSNVMIEGVFDQGSPALYGYIAATPKQTADVVLTSNQDDPILSTWQYGLGKTVAWNSDATNEWTADFAGWEQYPLLWSNMIQYVISDTELGDDILEIDKSGNSATIHYETKEYTKDTAVQAIVTDEEGNAKELTLSAVKPGVFEAELSEDAVGVYNVSVRKQNGEEIIKNYNTAYANQYSAEYQFTDHCDELESFVKQADGKEITMDDNLWENKQMLSRSRISLTTAFLILAIVLLLFDIAVRRLSIDVVKYMQIGMQKLLSPWKRFAAAHQRKKDKISGIDKSEPERTEPSKDPASANASKQRRPEKKKAEAEKQPAKEQSDMLDMNALLKKKKDRE